MRLPFATAVSVLAIVAAPTQIGILPTPIAPQPVSQLKTYLNLTETQVQNLMQIQVNRSNAQQGTADAVGQLEIDINNLRKQLPLPGSGYRSQALAVACSDSQVARPPQPFMGYGTCADLWPTPATSRRATGTSGCQR